jgi:hypothetical protein
MKDAGWNDNNAILTFHFSQFFLSFLPLKGLLLIKTDPVCVCVCARARACVCSYFVFNTK